MRGAYLFDHNFRAIAPVAPVLPPPLIPETYKEEGGGYPKGAYLDGIWNNFSLGYLINQQQAHTSVRFSEANIHLKAITLYANETQNAWITAGSLCSSNCQWYLCC